MITQQAAKYRANKGGVKLCIFCSMFRFPHSCTLVESSDEHPIKPQGGCQYWENMLTGKGKPDE